ncbi:alternative ribosome rescue aminoacyl-tRNA hydrolase ArfB [Stackebrandtia soli]|uniref:alternative ribosome rescue aminoacyl-tRNA hydrolase ArfB n=1 Tax=Stackebrandtia soli TaxID=1892856 RepID=UPI0039EB8D76
MSGKLEITGTVRIDEASLRWRFSRSSGPGGQGVNTTDSRVELSLALTDILGVSPERLELARQRLAQRLVDDVLTIAASRYRSQLRNREDAKERLVVLLREALNTDEKKRRPTKPSRGARMRRLNDKRHRSDLKKSRRLTD